METPWERSPWHTIGQMPPELEAMDVRLFRYMASEARNKTGSRPLSDGQAFLEWFVDGLRMRFPTEIEKGFDPPTVLHGQLVQLLSEGHPVQGPWGHVALEDGVVILHSAKRER